MATVGQITCSKTFFFIRIGDLLPFLALDEKPMQAGLSGEYGTEYVNFYYEASILNSNLYIVN